MPSILGKVSFNSSRSAVFNPAEPGIANVPVVLQNTTSNLGLVVLTDTNGNFEFINVPDGNYRLVEAYGTTGGVPSPGNFATAVVGSVPVGIDPPISLVPTAPAGATNLDSLSPNTILLTVEGANLTNQNFLDGPVKYTTYIDECATLVGPNLITAGDNGIFGTYAAGTPVNYAPAVNPYPGITEGTLTYVTTITNFGEFTLRNIFLDVADVWWKMANKTTADETSGMIVVDPAEAGNEVVFSQLVAVEANTQYLFAIWVANLIKVTGLIDPQLKVRVLDQFGSVMIDEVLSAPLAPNTNYPEWVRLGTAVNTGSNTQITVKLMTASAGSSGNDFVVDDIVFSKIDTPDFIPVKSANKVIILPGQEITYTTTLENTCQSPLTNVYFQDNIPVGTTFVDESVIINGTGYPLLKPQDGFNVDNIAGETTTTISFKVEVNTDLSSTEFNGIVENTGFMSYKYTPIVGGVPILYEYNTNQVDIPVNGCDYLSQQFINLINNDVDDLDCENLLDGVNALVFKFNNLLKLTREYIIDVMINNNDLNVAFKSQLERFVAILDTYIYMTNSLVFENNCNIEIFAYLLALIVETSLVIIQLLKLLCGILSFVGKCGCIGDLSVEALIGKFINNVTILFCIADDWRSIMVWIYQSKEQVGPSYAAAFVPRQSILPPPPRPMRYACTPCPPKPQPINLQQCGVPTNYMPYNPNGCN